jgi:hypothetical protein
MKSIIYLIIAIIMTSLVVALPTEVEVRDLTPIEAFFAELEVQDGTAFFVTGGGFSDNEDVYLGDLIDLEVNIKFKNNANMPTNNDEFYMLELWFVDESSLTTATSDAELRKQFIGQYKFKTPHVAGDWVKATIRNVKTSIMSDSFCSKGIKFVGHHYNWDGNQQKWVLDTPGETLRERKSLSNFRLVCPENNPCGTETVDLGYVCRFNEERWMKQSTPYLLDDGTCQIQYTKKDCYAGFRCEGGKCVQKFVCDDGDTRCSYNGLFQDKCYMNTWQNDKLCEEGCEPANAVCTEDIATPPEKSCGEKECTDDDAGKTEKDPEIECEYPCEEDYICSTGETRAECVDGCYEVLIEACPDVEESEEQSTEVQSGSGSLPTSSVDTETQSESTTKSTVEENEILAFLEENPLVVLVIVFASVFGALYIARPGTFNPKKKRRKR